MNKSCKNCSNCFQVECENTLLCVVGGDFQEEIIFSPEETCQNCQKFDQITK